MTFYDTSELPSVLVNMKVIGQAEQGCCYGSLRIVGARLRR